MRRSSARLIVLAATVALCGCKFGPAATPTGVGGTGGSGNSTGIAGTGGMLPPPPPPPPFDAGSFDGNGMSTVDMNCGARNKPAAKLLPDILIVLDRSGSMNENVMNTMCTSDGGAGGRGGTPTDCGRDSKWAKVTPALMDVVTATNAEVNWGLKFFPDNSMPANLCNVSATAAVPIAASNAMAVNTAIMGATSTTGGVIGYNNTPTRNAMTGATTYLTGLTTPNPKYVLLATDGAPNCAAAGGMGSADAAGATMSIAAAKTAGFPTFVVGIATGGGTADMTLSDMANAGGLARMGTPTYYPVSTGMELSDAIKTLVGVAATCTFQIGPAPTTDGTTDLKEINVFGDGVEIKKDTTHTDGYDYTDSKMGSIQIYGPTCPKVMSGEIHEVNVTFKCLVP